MNTFEFTRRLEKITPKVVQEIGVEAMHRNEVIVVFDSINANLQGLTFAGNKIDVRPFTDWDETGEFHQNLEFQDDTDINFQSSGAGAEAVFSAFTYNDTIAPSAKIISQLAINKVTQSFIQILKDKIKQ
jgi:hypothetical protein